jgi:hypothetical protein
MINYYNYKFNIIIKKLMMKYNLCTWIYALGFMHLDLCTWICFL